MQLRIVRCSYQERCRRQAAGKEGVSPVSLLVPYRVGRLCRCVATVRVPGTLRAAARRIQSQTQNDYGYESHFSVPNGCTFARTSNDES